MFNQTSKKMALWFFGIIGVGVVVWLGALYLNPEERAKRDTLKYFEDLQAQYESDTFGGATPEETLQLFITALEAGDIELASKYFLPDEREETVELLQNEFDVDKNFDHLVFVLKELKQNGGETKEDKAFFLKINKENVVTTEVVLTRNQNNVWKITDL